MMPESATRALRVVFRADDAGSCVSANAAIERAVREGPVRNVSVMACGPAMEDAARRLSKLDVCIGLHVTLNAEWQEVKWGPVASPSAVPTLLDPGTRVFTASPHLLHERGFDLDEALLEVRAQLAELRAHGLRPAYLDEHMGVGWLPGLHEGLEHLARTEGLLVASALPLSNLCAEHPAEESTLERWLAALAAALPGDYLLVTHPGLAAPDMESFRLPGQSGGEVARERQEETEALVSPSLKAALRRHSVQSVSYDTLTS